MPNTATTGSRSAAETPPTELHREPMDRATFEAACHQFLSIRSQLEDIELERNRLGLKLGQLNQAIAGHVGPLEHPMVIESQGMLLVVNVAEGLLKTGLVTCTVTEAVAAGEVLDDAPAGTEYDCRCPECGSSVIYPITEDGDKWKCDICLSTVSYAEAHGEVAA